MNKEEGLKAECTYNTELELVLRTLLLYFSNISQNSNRDDTISMISSCILPAAFMVQCPIVSQVCSGTQAVKLNTYLDGDGIITYYAYYWAVKAL